ncbi:hypothetical protein Dsin_021973 [Dipteronia sinensis]|uniref:Transmembrane protein n=1 Tax=Dipteronia sinensis TaxID=43782 RepID=A0AAE0A0W5_9ROSI|nr:hypothetical protein Dsin_021973 [Dipteronia sinensis]
MANSTYFYIPLLILSIIVHVLFVNQNTTIVTSNDDKVTLIKKSCNDTKFLDIYLSVLYADSRNRSTTNLKSLTTLSMNKRTAPCYCLSSP